MQIVYVCKVTKETNIQHFAWIETETVIYASRSHEIGSETLFSPTYLLVQGLWERFGERSLSFVRRPIFTNYPIMPFERDLVKVAAKSLRYSKFGIPYGKEIQWIGPHCIHDFPQYQRLQDRQPVLARLKSSGGHILLESESGARKNRTLHAEVNLVQKWFLKTKNKIPRGSVIEVTHKPCQMCAGLIVHWCEDVATLRVYFEVPILGRRSRVTALDRLGIQEQRKFVLI